MSDYCRGAMNCAPGTWIGSPRGRNELRPYAFIIAPHWGTSFTFALLQHISATAYSPYHDPGHLYSHSPESFENHPHPPYRYRFF